MDGAELAINVDGAADGADVAALRSLDAFAANVGHTGRHQGHSAMVGRYDAAEAFVAVVRATQVRGGVRMAKPNRPVGENHAAVDITGLPRAEVVLTQKIGEYVHDRLDSRLPV